MNAKNLLSISLVLAFMGGCYYDNQEDLFSNYPQTNCDTSAVTYTEDISWIMDTYCVSCHGGSAPQSGLDLSSYQGVQTAAQNGKLLDRISRPQGDALLMPPTGKMSDCNIDKVRVWVNKGAINN
ncbi:MAG: hypothetical protein LPK28_07835 [Bacteroidota bacterium]|nr:hypothetical protein [Bacteroidota bacterium]